MSEISVFVKNALNEDIQRGDLFSKVAISKNINAVVISKNKDNCICSGEVYATKLAKLKNIKTKFLKKDGDKIKYGDVIVRLSGKSNNLLQIERVLLNLLQHSSAIASKTNILKQQLKQTNTILLDTRKTTPNLRVFEKYSTLNGGCINHRFGLDDCLMIKDTHLKIIKNLHAFIKKAKIKIPWSSKIEVECANIQDAKDAMKCGCDIVMCDNMSPQDTLEVVCFRNKNFSHILIEASGNIDENNIKEYALISKVDAISSGSITHQATWLDFSLRVI